VTEPVILIGDGGHAKVVFEAMRVMGWTCAGVVAPDGGKFAGAASLGDDEAAFARFPQGGRAALGLGGIPSQGAPGTALRRRVYEAYTARGFVFPPLIGAGAILAADVELADGAQIMAGAVLQPGVRIGRNAMVNTGACVDHDTVVEDHAMIAPRAALCGNVTIRSGAYVGAGAIVLQGVTIGAGAVVAAGATATASVPDGGYVSRR
jgi:UDP-perosamine 4-acetyltransferase